MPKRKLIGKVVSTKNQNTLVVSVERIKEHEKYRKRIKFHKKYKAHVDGGEYQIGDNVIIEETKPISKDKRWKVISKNSE
jgi:small subunit ribosomal protein S17